MIFNSITFLCLFLPLTLILYFFADRRYRNFIALAASLVFFAWGQMFYVPLMLVVIVANYLLGKEIERNLTQEKKARRMLWLGIGLNLALLVFFKILVGYGAGWLGGILPKTALVTIQASPIPLGLSYITFQVVSYLIDVYNEMCESEKNFWNFALYIMLFPKIITGPITRYRDLAAQLVERTVDSASIAAGARRFITGLAKKVLIADRLGQVVNPAFSMAAPSFSTGIAWLVLLGYALQLYFDFSGYTDMAIGLGQMLGFRFVENFNTPYIARSISDFWRRWHISLSGWFRDYVFYPLEFTRRRGSLIRQQLNILVVFLLTGLWHGLTPTFAVWGLVHGVAMALEMTGFGRWLKKAWRPFQHLYTMAVVLLGWVFFRSPDLTYALSLILRLGGSQRGVAPLRFSVTQPLPFIDPSVWIAFAFGLLFSLPVGPWLNKGVSRLEEKYKGLSTPLMVSTDLFLLLLLVGSVITLVGSSYVVAIYGRF